MDFRHSLLVDFRRQCMLESRLSSFITASRSNGSELKRTAIIAINLKKLNSRSTALHRYVVPVLIDTVFDLETLLVSSVADPGCLSRILIFTPDPDFYPSRIPDPGSRIQKQQQKREVKKN